MQLFISSIEAVTCITLNVRYIYFISQTFPDKGAERDINKCKVRCGWSGCEWRGTFKDFKVNILLYISYRILEMQCDRNMK